jgi:hypothetical protein
LITSEKGEQFIADFTVDQFVYGGEMWFTDRETYQDRVCGGWGDVYLAEEEWWVETGEEVGDGMGIWAVCEAVRDGCGVICSREFRDMEDEERGEWLRDRVVADILRHEKWEDGK